MANDDAVQDLLPNPRNEEEYIKWVELLVRQKEKRVAIGETLRERLLIDHVGEGWRDRLANMYQETDRLTHNPRSIPVSSCIMTDADIGLSLRHVMADGKTHFKGTSGEGVLAVLCHNAYAAKEVGNYAKARRFAWRAMWHDPYQQAAWRLLAVAVLGRLGRLMRRALLPRV